MIGSAVFLVVAGLIEGFISPSSLPAMMKIAVGVLSGILMYGYLMLAGRKEEPPANMLLSES